MFGVIGTIIALCLAFVLVAYFATMYVREIAKARIIEREHQVDVREQRTDAVKRSRSVIEGQVFEQLVPHFPEWKHTPSEARFIGSPIDFVVFEGMSTGNPDKIILVEVKKGSSTTTPLQNKIKKLIKEGKVEWETLKLE